MTNDLFIWTFFTLCLAVSFGLSGMEAGVFALSRLRIRRLMRTGSRSAKLLHDYLEHPEDFLWTILVGNTLANSLILGWLVVLLFHSLAGYPIWFILVYVPLVLLFYTLFDLLPKMLFRTYSNRLSIMLVRPFRIVHLLLRPLVAAVEGVSDLLLRWRGGKAFTGRLFGNREELRLLMQESATGFTSEERAMINRVLDLQSLTVRQAMTPLSKMLTISAAAPLGEALELCRSRKVSRLPVLESRDHQQRIIGLLNINTLLFQPDLDPARPVREHIKPALYLEEDLRLELALRRMQRGGQRVGIVLGRDRQENGILSLQDVLKVVFGEVSL